MRKILPLWLWRSQILLRDYWVGIRSRCLYSRRLYQISLDRRAIGDQFVHFPTGLGMQQMNPFKKWIKTKYCETFRYFETFSLRDNRIEYTHVSLFLDNTSWIAVVTTTNCPKSVWNRVIEVFGSSVVLSLDCLCIFWWYRGLSYNWVKSLPLSHPINELHQLLSLCEH